MPTLNTSLRAKFNFSTPPVSKYFESKGSMDVKGYFIFSENDKALLKFVIYTYNIVSFIQFLINIF